MARSTPLHLEYRRFVYRVMKNRCGYTLFGTDERYP